MATITCRCCGATFALAGDGAVTCKVCGTVQAMQDAQSNTLRHAFLALESGDPNAAYQASEKALEKDPHCAEAYLIKAMLQCGAPTVEKLASSQYSIEENTNFQTALRMAEGNYKTFLQGLVQKNKKSIEENRFSTVYYDAIELAKKDTEESYTSSLAKLKSIPEDFYDVAEQITRIEGLLQDLQKKREAEEEAKAYRKKKLKRKLKKTAIYAGIVVAVLLVALIILFFVDRAQSNGLDIDIRGDNAVVVWVDDKDTTSVTIPETYWGKPVTKVGGFQNCTELTSVTIPSGVTEILDYAFDGCTGLTSITIPDSVTTIGGSAFEGCTGLTSITIPDSVTTIDFYAFNGCTGLTSITIPDSVTTIRDYAFNGCTGLTSITLPSLNVISEGKIHNFFNRYIFDAVPDSLKTVVITGGTTIGDEAFYQCTGLTSITIPDSVTTIGNYAFIGCTGLTSITIPDSVTTIGNSAFHSCTGLTSITIPDSVTTIGDSAFQGCTGLTSIAIPDSVTTIGDSAFQGCTGLTSITIPDSVTTIGSYAFYGCTGLTSITIPDSVTTIGIYAFTDCTGLTSITIGDSVTTIGDDAFRGCTGLTLINIPASVISIGKYAFYECDGLVGVIFEIKTGWCANNLEMAALSLATENASLLTGSYSDCAWKRTANS